MHFLPQLSNIFTQSKSFIPNFTPWKLRKSRQISHLNLMKLRDMAPSREKSIKYSLFKLVKIYPLITSFYKTAQGPTRFLPQPSNIFCTDISAISVTFCKSGQKKKIEKWERKRCYTCVLSEKRSQPKENKTSWLASQLGISRNNIRENQTLLLLEAKVINISIFWNMWMKEYRLCFTVE